MEHLIVNVTESEWKPRQKHDQNFKMEGKPLSNWKEERNKFKRAGL